MASSSSADSRGQITVDQIDAARRLCFDAILVHKESLADFRSILAAASDTDSDPDKYGRLGEHWSFTNARLHEIWKELAITVRSEVLEVIELGNAGHDTSVSIRWAGSGQPESLRRATFHDAAYLLPCMLINCTEFVDPATALQNHHRAIAQRLARANDVDVSDWKCRLSFEWRNAVAWIERRSATGQPDNGTDNEENNLRFTDPPEDVRRAALFLRRQSKEPGSKLDLLTQHAGNVEEAKRLANELKPSRYGTYLLAGTRFLRTTSGQRK